ncbi:hypothetical protein GEMRC1_013349 [Eukaryota sp. GEM-RC1]
MKGLDHISCIPLDHSVTTAWSAICFDPSLSVLLTNMRLLLKMVRGPLHFVILNILSLTLPLFLCPGFFLVVLQQPPVLNIISASIYSDFSSSFSSTRLETRLDVDFAHSTCR